MNVAFGCHLAIIKVMIESEIRILNELKFPLILFIFYWNLLITYSGSLDFRFLFYTLYSLIIFHI